MNHGYLVYSAYIRPSNLGFTVGVPDAAITATCIRACRGNMVSPHASTPTAPVLVLIWLVVWWLSQHELLLHPASICPDAGPDLCTLRWWCFPSINRCKYSTGTCGGQHLLQLELVVFSFQQLAQILHLHMWWSSPVATCAGGVFSSNH